MNTIFNSREPLYRNPCGAVPENTRIHFKIFLPRSLKCISASLKVTGDQNSSFTSLSMFWCGMHGDNYEMWECDYNAEYSGLYWYYFSLDTINGTQAVFKNQNSSYGSLGGSEQWQLTVYDKDFKTPDWLCGGIMYQIFPDRFCNSGKEKDNVPTDRIMQDSWFAQPDWRPNKKGVVTNKEFFGGDLNGIIQNLDYLQSLGVTCLYLNPIFESHSNHRYDTADYSKIDPSLGTESDFKLLCKELKKRNMHLILDGVFSHTGSDSVYFNREGRYKSLGAFNSKDSKYFSWYNFIEWPEKYNSWWGFPTLPELEETNPNYNEYINGKKGIVKKWLKSGANGWRLDVADELPDSFIENLRSAAKEEKDDALIIGEVWEDASKKESYSHRRKFLLGHQLDSVMNYPYRNAILGFFTGVSSYDTMEIILSIAENYPKPALRLLMNSISTHDTERAITVLAGEPSNGRNKEWQSKSYLSEKQRIRGIKLLKTAAAMQYTLPGVPCIYYGDEAGLEGYKDPLNRTGYPWGKENIELIEWHKSLAEFRNKFKVLYEGDILPFRTDDKLISYIRSDNSSKLLCAFNSDCNEKTITLPDGWDRAKAALNSIIKDGKILVPSEGFAFAYIQSDN